MINKTELAAKIRQAKQNTPDISIRSLSRRFKVHHSVVTKALAGSEPPQKVETSEQTKDTWTITLPQTRIHTLDELIEYCQVDLAVWSVDRFTVNKWEMGAKDDNGKVVVTPLYQVKAFLKKKTGIDPKKEIEELKTKAKELAHLPPRVVKPSKPSKYSLELALVDHHFGKLGWKDETGYESYDLKIAEKVWWEAFDTLLDRVKHYSFEEVLFCVGNDIMQFDDTESQTTKGTLVSSDGRYQKVFSKVRDTLIKSIEELRKHCKIVRVYLVSGNHDSLSVWTLGSSLEMYFRLYPDVQIENSPKPRKYYRYGKNLIMFTHGHKNKLADLPLLMATENSKEFGETTYREIHVGHRHTKQSEVVLLKDIQEKHGIRVRILSSLSGVDDYHSEHGFVGNLRSSEAFIWSHDEGLIGTAVYTYEEKN
jgi:hypothetical protein